MPADKQFSLGNVFAVALGGAIGGGLRYSLSLPFYENSGTLAWIILLENLTGAFLLGFILSHTTWRFYADTHSRLFLTTGVLGSFTTFSAYSLYITNWSLQGAAPVALLYSLGSIFLGLMAAYAGISLAQRLKREQC